VHGRQKEFFQGGGTIGFFLTFFYGGPKVVKFVFYHSKLRALFAEIFKFLPLFQHPYACVLCVGKVRATPLKIWGNFKRFKTIPNSEILLNP